MAWAIYHYSSTNPWFFQKRNGSLQSMLGTVVPLFHCYLSLGLGRVSKHLSFTREAVPSFKKNHILCHSFWACKQCGSYLRSSQPGTHGQSMLKLSGKELLEILEINEPGSGEISGQEPMVQWDIKLTVFNKSEWMLYGRCQVSNSWGEGSAYFKSNNS